MLKIRRIINIQHGSSMGQKILDLIDDVHAAVADSRHRRLARRLSHGMLAGRRRWPPASAGSLEESRPGNFWRLFFHKPLNVLLPTTSWTYGEARGNIRVSPIVTAQRIPNEIAMP
jgi:hypothetical protein